MKKNAGVTLIELVVVLAIIVIIGAIVVPNFFGMTEGARLRADIQSTVVLRNAFELYRLQNPGSSHGAIQSVLDSLHERGFISSRLSYDDSPQTVGAEWRLSGNTIQLYIPSALHDAHYDTLTSQESAIVTALP